MSTSSDGPQADPGGSTADPGGATAELHSDLLRANRAFAAEAAGAEASKRPVRQLFVLTCMDARVDPLRLLGLRAGDAHVVRNAGGRVTDDVVRSLLLSSTLLGTRHAVVVHHTDCGLHAPSDEHVRAQLRERGADPGDMAIGTFADVERGVRDDVAALTSDPLIGSSVTVRGYVYDVRSHRLRAIGGA